MSFAVVETVYVGQHVMVKAEVVKLTQVKKDNSGRFNMVHAVLVDTQSSIKLILWESFVNTVQAGSTYLFYNLTVCRDKFTNEINRNTAQPKTPIKIAENFQQSI